MPPFTHTLAVRFADVDHAGIVYYPRFLHYFHVCFEEFFRAKMGARAYVELLDDRRIGFPAVRAECSYQAPLAFGDSAKIEMRVAELGDKSVTFGYRIWRLDEAGSTAPVLAAEGQTICAVVDLEAFRAVPIPDDLRELFASLR